MPFVQSGSNWQWTGGGEPSKDEYDQAMVGLNAAKASGAAGGSVGGWDTKPSWMGGESASADQPNPGMANPPVGIDEGAGSGGGISGGLGLGAPASPPMPGAAPESGSAMAGLQAAAPETGNEFSKTAPGALNPNLGKRNYPNEISGLRALTY